MEKETTRYSGLTLIEAPTAAWWEELVAGLKLNLERNRQPLKLPPIEDDDPE